MSSESKSKPLIMKMRRTKSYMRTATGSSSLLFNMKNYLDIKYLKYIDNGDICLCKHAGTYGFLITKITYLISSVNLK